ncbi:MAG: sigma 54-interacting transcriptional regulator [Deltaproteobacteria bacterium]|nr:sigma 54-interacting transcriptional regulator [Deltaproteobacteria bacterium]
MAGLKRIDHRYEVVKSLGAGLSGEILLVSDEESNKAALKFLKKIQLNISRAEALENFKNEFSILKELNHPNISRILDFGYDSVLQRYYFTCEFIEGAELHVACKNLPVETIEKLIVQVLRALNYLHSRGIYHFDIKPQNILVQTHDHSSLKAQLIDFGLAGFSSPRKKIGTPAYMAPEVIRGGVLDGRTDLYSVGVVTYKILTGTNPFSSKNLKETFHNQLYLVPKPASEINPAIPKYWDHILARLLEKNPANRYPQASLVIRDLNFLSNKTFEIETKDTRLSYLPEKGALIGREKEWKKFVEIFENIFLTDKPFQERLLIVEGHKGSGKTRVLSEIKYFSQLNNITVKTLRQLETETTENNFVLLIDSEQADANRVNALMQELDKDKFLIIWATESAPANWMNCNVIRLENYTHIQLKQYVESVTGLSSAPEHLINELAQRTSGNPLFVTEFIKSLFELNLFLDSHGKWDATTFEDIKIDFGQIHIPSSVEEYFRDKYCKLPADLKEITRWIAVNNQPIFIEDLATVSRSTNIQLKIMELINQNILEKTTREHSYYFKNLLFADAIYSTIPKNEAAICHDALKNIYKDNSKKREQYLYHQGHGLYLDEAKEGLLELGKLYFKSARYKDSITTFCLLLDITNTPFGDTEIKARFELGECYKHSHQYENAVTEYRALQHYFSNEVQAKENKNLLLTLHKLVDVFIKMRDLKAAKECCDLAQNIISGHPDTLAYDLIFKNHGAYIKLKEGKLEEAESIYCNTKLEWAEGLNETEKAMVDNNRLIEVYVIKQKTDLAIELCLKDIKTFTGYNNNNALALNYYALGDVYYRMATAETHKNRTAFFKKGSEYFLECEKIARTIDNIRYMMLAFNGLGNIYSDDKDNKELLNKALDYYNRALAMARKLETLFDAALISYNIASIHKLINNMKDAYSYLVYAINTLENIKEQRSPHTELNLYLCYILFSEIHITNSEFQKAHQAVDRAEEYFKQTDVIKIYEYYLHARRASAYLGENKTEQGIKALQTARKLAQKEDEKEDLKKIIDKYQINKEQISPQADREIKVMTTEIKTTNDDLKKIIEINKFINSEHNPDQLLNLVLNYAIQLSNAEAGFVLLLDEDRSFSIKASMNTNKTDEEKISMSIAKMAIETGEIISSSDALSDDRFDSSESIVLNELKSVLCLPIKSKNKSIGVFYLDNRYRINAFDNSNINLLNAFCDQAGIALENSKLINELMAAQKQLREKLEKTAEELAHVKNILKSESETYQTRYAYNNIISKSREMQNIFKILDKVTETSLSILIYGESGTGKELVAKALHYNNAQRSHKRFIAINCGAIPMNLMESELFGHKAGSFTGAIRDKKGLFEEAGGGTILLDEIGELDLQLQVKLLRVLQEGEVQRIGDSKTVKVDVRIICATHRDLNELIKENKFREDLYYRLCQMKIDLPSLKNRREDIPLLAKHFVEKYKEQNKLKEDILIPPLFMKYLLEYSWPGNIRELENLISVSCALKDGNLLSMDNIPPSYGIKQMADQNLNAAEQGLSHTQTFKQTSIPIDEHNAFDPRKTWQDYESVILAKAYEFHKKKKMPAAEALKLSHSTIYKKIDELNLDDSSNPLFADNFIYQNGTCMKDYILKIFSAALKYHENHPYAAIKQLDISQGYFYKIMKEFKKQEESTESKQEETTEIVEE